MVRALGHHFQRARREFGFEEGVFVDGAFLGSTEVIALAELPAPVRQRLAEARKNRKHIACRSVQAYMAAMEVSLDELIQHIGEQARLLEQMRTRALQKAMEKKPLDPLIPPAGTRAMISG